VDGLMRQLRERITSDDTAAIEAATKSLAEGTELLAARRMNRGIQQALTGRRLDEI
jgi:molecular chaperone HscA